MGFSRKKFEEKQNEMLYKNQRVQKKIKEGRDDRLAVSIRIKI